MRMVEAIAFHVIGQAPLLAARQRVIYFPRTLPPDGLMLLEACPAPLYRMLWRIHRVRRT